MGIVAFLALPAVRAIAVRTAKNILILGATATAAYFSNNVFKLQANSAVKNAMEDFALVRSMTRG
jgi:hypothetical protein